MSTKAKSRITSAAVKFLTTPSSGDPERDARRLEAIARSYASQILGEKNVPRLREALRALASDGYGNLAKQAQEAGRIMSANDIARLEQMKSAFDQTVKAGMLNLGTAISWVAGGTGEASAPDAPEIAAGPISDTDSSRRQVAKFQEIQAAERLRNVESEIAKTEFQRRSDVASVLRDQVDEMEHALQLSSDLDIRLESSVGLYEQANRALERRDELVKEVADADPLGAPTEAQMAKLREAGDLAIKAEELRKKAQEFETKYASTGGIRPPTDEELSRLERGTALQEKITNFKTRIKELESKGPDRLALDAERAQNVENPTFNRNYLTPGQGVLDGAMTFVAQARSVGEQISEAVSGGLNSALSVTTDHLTNAILLTENWRTAIGNIEMFIVSELVSSIIRMGLQWVATHLIMKGVTLGWHALKSALGWAEVAETNEQELAKTPMLTMNAGLASVGSFGIAAIAGLAALLLVMGTLGGFESGGYTANGPSNRVAGVVHAGEWVAPQWMTSDPYAANVIAGLENYRLGAPTVPNFSGGSSGSSGSIGGSAGGGSSVHVSFFNSQHETETFLRSQVGEQIMVDWLNQRGYVRA